MKLKTISYAKVFPLAAYVNEKIGVEIELDELDGYEETFAQAKQLVEKFHKDNNPQLVEGGTVTWDLPVEDRSVQGPRVDAIIADINSCTELKVLETYRLMAKMSPKLQEAYDTQFANLQPSNTIQNESN